MNSATALRIPLLSAFAILTMGINVFGQDPDLPRMDPDDTPRISRLPAVDRTGPPSPAGNPEDTPAESAAVPPATEDSLATVDDLVDEPWYDAWAPWSDYWWQPEKTWEGSFEFGLNGTEGNSEAFNLRFGGKLKRKTDFSSHELEMLYNDQSNAGLNTARNLLVNGRIEWPLADTPWSLYVHGLGEYDEFKAFDLRLSGDAGVGYKFIETDTTKIKGRVGGSASKEFGGPNDDVTPELAFGLEAERKLSDRQKTSLVVDYYPSVEDFSDARINTNLSWEVVVDPDWGLSLKLSLIDRYDSTPSGAKHNDINYAALMLWSF